MSSSAGSAPEIPPRAELMERIREKIRKQDQVLWPTVSEKIQAVKAAKRVEAIKNPDHEHRTVFHLDLDHVLLTGVPVDSGRVTEPSPGWTVTVKGCDRGGHPLIVFVHLGSDVREPLQVTDFIIAPKE
ncbi:MAG: hypothetical protein WCA13_08195 [Terriglobales bacterium]